MANKKKRKRDKKGATTSAMAGLVVGLAEAPSQGLANSATEKLGLTRDAAGDGSADEPGDATVSRKKRAKGAKKGGRRARGGKHKRNAVDVQRLVDFARASRKRLTRLAEKLHRVSTKREALLDELETMHRAIGDVLARARAYTQGASRKQAEKTRAERADGRAKESPA